MNDTPTPDTAANPLCRLHPLVKLAWLAAATGAVFISSSPLTAAGLVVLTLLGLWQIGIPPRRIPARWLYLALAAGLILLHVLTVRRGTPLWGPVTTAGLARGILAAARLATVLLGGAFFVAATDPADLAQALTMLHLPYRWAFALMTALRLSPVFRGEANTVYQAQLARGVRYDAGPLRRRWLMLRRLLLPLLVSSLRTASNLSATMENRGFGLQPRRTTLRQVPCRKTDVAALLAGLAAIGGLFLSGYLV